MLQKFVLNSVHLHFIIRIVLKVLINQYQVLYAVPETVLSITALNCLMLIDIIHMY